MTGRRHRLATFALVASALFLAAAGQAPAIPMEYHGPYVAFDRMRGGNGDVYVANGNGGAPMIDVTPDPAVDLRPSWEPTRTLNGCRDTGLPVDPQRLAFESNRGTGGTFDIYTVYPDIPTNSLQSHVPLDVTNTPATDDTEAAWSPVFGTATGERSVLAYASAPAGSSSHDIWVVDPETGTKVDITNDPTADESNPDWSPGGQAPQYLAYDSDRSGSRQIWIAKLADADNDGIPDGIDGQPVQVTFDATPASDPSWVTYYGLPSADTTVTQQIAYRTDQFGTSYLNILEHDTVLSALTGGEVPFVPAATIEITLTGDPGGDEAPAWSAVGAELAYDTTRFDPAGVNHDIHVLRGFASYYVADAEPLTPEPAPLVSDLADDRHPALQGAPNCAEMIPHLPRPAPVSRGTRTSGSGGGGGSGSGSGDTGGQGTNTGATGGNAGTRALTVSRFRVASSGRGRGRRVTVTLTASRGARALLRLTHGRRSVAAARCTLHAGRNRCSLRLRRSAPAGLYRVTVTVTAGPTRIRLSGRVRVGR